MIYFCTETYIKNTGIVTSNVDVTQFSPLVQFAAKAFIKSQIGSYFFNDLLTKYNAQTLSADEEKVVERMQLAIVWRVCANAGVTLSNQLTNKGYMVQSDDNADSVESGTVWKMYDHYIQQALYFELELKQYLKDNKDLYPNYISSLNNDSSIKDSCGSGDSDFNEGVGLMFI